MWGRARSRSVFCMRRIDAQETAVANMRLPGPYRLAILKKGHVNEASLCGPLLQPDSSSQAAVSSIKRAATPPGYRRQVRADAGVMVITSATQAPGVGTSTLAPCLSIILLMMSPAEALETTRTPRAAGLTGERTAFITTRPFRAAIIRLPRRA